MTERDKVGIDRIGTARVISRLDEVQAFQIDWRDPKYGGTGSTLTDYVLAYSHAHALMVWLDHFSAGQQREDAPSPDWVIACRRANSRRPIDGSQKREPFLVEGPLLTKGTWVDEPVRQINLEGGPGGMIDG